MILAAIIISPFSFASNIEAPLLRYFQERSQGISDEISVEIKTDSISSFHCEKPEFSTPGNRRLWGNISVMMRCGNDKRFLQVHVGAVGYYVVATHFIARGTTLDSRAVTLKRGRLDTLPANTLTVKEQAINAVTLRDITPGLPLTHVMLRQSWRVKAGQQVRVIFHGRGFRINSEGRALNNAIVGQHTRIRMVSGQLITGIVDADGNIQVDR